MEQQNKFLEILKINSGREEKLDQDLLEKAFNKAWDLFKSGFKSSDNPFLLSFLELEPNHLAITVHMQDYAFIVDSLLLTFREFPLKEKFLAIPVFAVTRDENSILETFRQGEGANQESLSLYIFEKTNSFNLDLLRRKLEETLHMIIKANQAWLPNREKIAKLEKNRPFFDWLLDNNFIFLGSFEWEKGSIENLTGLLEGTYYKAEDFLLKETFSQDLNFRRSHLLSRIHRKTNMEIISIKKSDQSYLFLIGFFTSAVYFQPVTSIPVIQNKIDLAIAKNNALIRAGYLFKELIAELQSYPRSELFQMDQKEFDDLISGLASIIKFPKTKVFAREGSDGFTSLLIFIPKEKFSMNLQAQIEKVLCDNLKVTIFKRYMKISEGSFMTLQFIAKSFQKSHCSLLELEILIGELLSDWEEQFKSLLNLSGQGQLKFTLSGQLFPEDYRYKNSPQEALEDLFKLGNLEAKPTIFLASHNKIKIYSKNKLEISALVPLLDNLAITVIEMESYHLRIEEQPYHLYSFIVRTMELSRLNLQELEDNFQEVIFNDYLEDDSFNRLILLIGLTWKEVLIARAFFAYLKQLGTHYNKEELLEAFIANPEATLALFNLFHQKFSGTKNPEALQVAQADFLKLLSKIDNSLADKILRDYFSVIKAIKRSNILFWQESHYLAFKFATQELDFAPLPKPYREIFIYAKDFEALHMRGNKVARGGIRWSDRKSDYRTELLGLLKAQMSKNSIIVPDGAKGAFIVKNFPSNETFAQAGIRAYEAFLSGLLDLTDNFLNGELVLTDKSVIWDEGDPYLVVAADKGTATFSDRANQLSLSRNFWLGDAFASGGSAGYDHKKLAITSKGAWISVQEHSKKLGLNPEKDPITLVGIGDMSGDVFGNGLLRSQTIKLLAAFNHLHIFLDPNPNPQVSYNERLRLFNLPSSQWKDYNAALISKGGGVFDRKTKIISLSEEVKLALGIDSNLLEMKPDDLIKAILMAPVDLLWNGGIGTYVKASTEGHEMVGDKNNDQVRIDGKDLGAKMVAEGGNLGFTQLGRIEYARLGGLINSDAIDNSGGVDCSDHEVNIKIALASLGKNLPLEDRNALLESLAPEVVELVLQNNREQNEIISLDFNQGASKLEEAFWLIKVLEKRGELNPQLEKLPSQDKINELDQLTRPELAVLLAQAKNSATRALLQEDKLEELFELDLFTKLYLDYFPAQLHKEPYLSGLEGHKLKREILATLIVNNIINSMGIDYFHLQWLKMGLEPLSLVKNFFLVKYGLALSSHVKTRELQLLIESMTVNLPENWDNDFYHRLETLSKDFNTKALPLLLFTDVNLVSDYHSLYKNYLFITQLLNLDLKKLFQFLADKLHYTIRNAGLILLNNLEKKIVLLSQKGLKITGFHNKLEKEIGASIEKLEDKDPSKVLALLIMLEKNLDKLIKKFS